jgi:hypothetical protein
MRVNITLTNGSSLFGQFRKDWPSLTDIINTDCAFIQFIRPNGTEVLLNKLAIAYISEAPDDL